MPHGILGELSSVDLIYWADFFLKNDAFNTSSLVAVFEQVA